MIVANVPFCTFQVTPSTLATALRRPTSSPTFWLSTWPTCGSPEVPGWRVVPRDSCPLDRTLAGSSAFSFGSSVMPETTSVAGTAVEPAPAAGDPLDPAAPLGSAAGEEPPDEPPDEPQPASVRAQTTARAAATARTRGGR